MRVILLELSIYRNIRVFNKLLNAGDNMSLGQLCTKSSESTPMYSKLSTNSEQAVRTHSDNKLLQQRWYKSAAGLLQFRCVFTSVLNT
jgi:hypothetical protein